LPNTLLGLLIGYLAVAFGATAQKVDGCWEFYGGLVTWLLQRAPIGSGAMAMTIGHCILGQTKVALDITRQHEHVHVRQYEVWGPLFVPAYFTASAIAWLRGKNPYRDNFFEVEAYDSTSIVDQASKKNGD
jgi:hypothetical protein